MAVKKGLGKGLDALLGDYAEAPAGGAAEVDVYLIDTNTNQPRKEFDEEKLRELSESIARHGVVQPIILKPRGDRYIIVAGERRYRAARLAGLTRVPAIVKDMDEAQVMEVALIENLQRQDLNPIEEAAGIRFLMQQHDLTQEEVAERLSKSRPAIANSLRLLNLPEKVQEHIRRGELKPGAARVILSVEGEEEQLKLANRIMQTGMNVREAEQAARLAANKAKRRPSGHPDPDMRAAEEAMRERLGTRVSIQGSQSKGRVVIEYYSREELDGIYELLTYDVENR